VYPGYDADTMGSSQEVKHLTDALIKDSKKFEKEEVGLSEKKKHLTTKQKKFKKSLADVSRLPRKTCLYLMCNRTVIRDQKPLQI
jgi:hypothetical protein